MFPSSFVVLLLSGVFVGTSVLHARAEKVTAWPEEFDFVVVGAGAAGAAVAARLSENGQHRVLVLEAGEEPMYVSKIPYFGVGPFGGPMDWDFLSEPNPASCKNYPEQRIRIPRGKSLGGSTVINAMIVTRCNRRDYDQWAAMGNDGWDYDHLLPIFKKLENYGAPLTHPEDGAYHGYDGPVHVQQPPYKVPIEDIILEAGRELGYDEIDYNAATQTGFAKPVFIIHNGTRWTSYDAYLKPAMKRPNLSVLTHTLVTKVVVDEATKTTTGVVFERDGQMWRVSSRKEVILSAGSIGSPHLLMLSGIGPVETLNRFKIPVVQDVPGVGQNLHDHVVPGGLRFTIKENVGIDNGLAVNSQTFGQWETERQGPLTVPIRVHGVAFLNTPLNEPHRTDDYPDVELVVFSPPAFDVGLVPEALDSLGAMDGHRFPLMVLPILLRPKSVGNLTLRSADPRQQPAIHLNLLADPRDVDVLVEGMKLTYRLMDAKPFHDLGIHAVQLPLHGCEHLEPLSDAAFRCQMVHYTSHLYHPLGTCKMGPSSDPMAVVDPTLRVRGVRGLRVADASIMPTIVTGHTMVPSMLIGERVAAFVLEHWAHSDRQEL